MAGLRKLRHHGTAAGRLGGHLRVRRVQSRAPATATRGLGPGRRCRRPPVRAVRPPAPRVPRSKTPTNNAESPDPPQKTLVSEHPLRRVGYRNRSREMPQFPGSQKAQGVIHARQCFCFLNHAPYQDKEGLLLCFTCDLFAHSYLRLVFLAVELFRYLVLLQTQRCEPKDDIERQAVLT